MLQPVVERTARPGPRALPGVRFETAPVARSGVLPRLDVTGFVGYAEAGPLDTPVLVQDVERFREIFGGDVVLADGTGGPSSTDPVVGLLGPTVQAFFDNGGHSCWVVRVGIGAATTRFVVPGLVELGPPGDPTRFRPATLQARSPGAFWDDQAVVARVDRHPLSALPGSFSVDGWVDGELAVPGSSSVAPGELLEVVLESDRTLWVSVREVRQDAAGRRVLGWRAADETWLDPVRDTTATGPFPGRVVGPDRDDVVSVTSYDADADGSVRLVVELTPDRAPVPGDVVVVSDVATGPMVVTVGAPAIGEPAAGTTCVVEGWPARRIVPTTTARAGATDLDRAAVLDLGLATRRGDALTHVVEGLCLDSQHDRWFGRLPSDEELFGRSYRTLATGSPDSAAGPLDAATAHPRFGLAAAGAAPGRYLPIGLGTAYGVSAPGRAAPAPGDVHTRNGVARRDPDAFVDPGLAELGVEGLLVEARRRFHVDGEPLRGMHALLPLEDVAVVAAPDAGHGEWLRSAPEPSPVLTGPDLTWAVAADHLAWDDPFAVLDPTAPADEFLLEHSPAPDFTRGVSATTIGGALWHTPVVRGGCGPAFWRIRALRRGVTTPWSDTVRVPEERGPFDACEAELLVDPTPTLAGSTVSWTVGAGSPYELQTSPHPLFARDVSTTPTSRTHATLDPPPTGITYVRVRSTSPLGPWSITLALPAVPVGRWTLTTPGPLDPDRGVADASVTVHRALSVLAAARRDVTVLLSFPRWYGEEAVELHLGRLAEGDAAAGLDRLHAHHPWVLSTSSSGTQPLPPDGAVAGRLAHGSIQQGPWIAVAGQPLTGVLGVDDRTDVDPLRLRRAQVNAPVLTRRGVVLTGVDTLSGDGAVRPVTVRRLLILVQRLALREGRELVFEPHGPDLRRLLQTRFESVLGLMFRLGAFAGTTPAQAFRVLCDEGLNPERATDAGQVVVELQVAPSHPLELLVVRLVRSGDEGFRLADVAALTGAAR